MGNVVKRILNHFILDLPDNSPLKAIADFLGAPHGSHHQRLKKASANILKLFIISAQACPLSPYFFIQYRNL